MYVALIANTAWLDEELTAFRYLAVGLIDEQVRVAQVVPHQLDDHETSGFCDRVAWCDSRWPVMRKRRLGRLAQRLDKLGVDLIHALDGQVWAGAVSLARQLNTPVVLGVCSAMDVPQLDRLTRLDTLAKVAFTAATRPLAQAIGKKVESDTQVEVVPQGVHVPDMPHVRADQGGALCAVVSGNGVFDTSYESLLLALRSITIDYPQSQFFFDGQGTEQHRLWQAAKRYGLLSNASLVPRRLGHRELLLKADLLIHPQALGRARSITLQAMAHGIPVMALEDPWLDYLVDQQTAWVVDQPHPEVWERLVRQAIEDAPQTRAIATRARQWIRETHLASMQVGQTVGVYRQVSGESIKFPQPQMPR